MSLVAPCSASQTPVAPLAAKRTSKPTWKPIQLTYDSVTVSGGFSSKTFVVRTIIVETATNSDSFVEVTKNADWFLKTVGSDVMQKGQCKAVKVLNVLSDKLNAQHLLPTPVVPDSDSPPAVAGADYDPMDALDDGLQSVQSTPVKKAKSPYKKARHQILFVDMPMRPPCADASCTDTKQVSVYYSGKTAKKLYVHCDCIGWLLAYAADELHFQGVVDIDDNDDTKIANCTAVADLHVEWDFQKKLWQSEFVDGALRGVKRSFSQADNTVDRWDKLRRASMSTVDASFADASAADKKQVAKEFIVHWCASISRGDHHTFEADWGVKNNETTAVAVDITSVAEESTAVADANAQVDHISRTLFDDAIEV
jgi:hypothetical protein